MTEEMTLSEYHKKYGAKAEARLARSARKMRFKTKAQLRSKTDWEQALLDQIVDLGLPKPIRESWLEWFSSPDDEKAQADVRRLRYSVTAKTDILQMWVKKLDGLGIRPFEREIIL